MHGGGDGEKDGDGEIRDPFLERRPQTDHQADRADHDQQTADQLTPANVLLFHERLQHAGQSPRLSFRGLNPGSINARDDGCGRRCGNLCRLCFVDHFEDVDRFLDRRCDSLVPEALLRFLRRFPECGARHLIRSRRDRSRSGRHGRLPSLFAGRLGCRASLRVGSPRRRRQCPSRRDRRYPRRPRPELPGETRPKSGRPWPNDSPDGSSRRVHLPARRSSAFPSDNRT